MTTCQNCNGPHHVQACPELRAALFAPETCVDCGDLSIAPVCAARMEYQRCEQLAADRAIIAGMVRDDCDQWGISLDLRARILLDSCTIDQFAGF